MTPCGPFTISFPDGICRRMRADTLEDAITEASEAIEVTSRTQASILDADTYRVIGTVARRIWRNSPGSYTFTEEKQ